MFVHLVYLVAVILETTNGSNREVHWIAPCIGLGVAICGLQIVTTVLTAYCVDCYSSHSSAVTQFISFLRQVISFTVPFWNPPLNDKVGYGVGFGIEAIIVVTFYILVSSRTSRRKICTCVLVANQLS